MMSIYYSTARIFIFEHLMNNLPMTSKTPMIMILSCLAFLKIHIQFDDRCLMLKNPNYNNLKCLTLKLKDFEIFKHV